MIDRLFEVLGTASDALRRIGRPIGRGLSKVGRLVVGSIGAVRGVIGALLPIAAIAVVAGGAYLLFFRAEDPAIDYRFANAIGGEGSAVSCVYSNAKPNVEIVRGARGSGRPSRTSIAFDGATGLTFDESCDGAEPKLELSALSLVIPGSVPVRSERVEPERKATKAKTGKRAKGTGGGHGNTEDAGERASAGDRDRTIVFGVKLPEFLPF